jgi:signal peptidase I
MNPKLFKVLSFIWEMVKVVAVSLLIVLPIRYFLVQPFYVKGSSMEPNFHDYEYLIIDEISYRFNEPQHGQVVVMRDPLEKSKYFIKRIIGIPGDTILIKDGQVSRNGEALNETAYLSPSVETTGPIAVLDITLGDNEYYVMGDNRAASFDSRRFGPIDRSALIGRVWVRAWPVTKFTTY